MIFRKKFSYFGGKTALNTLIQGFEEGIWNNIRAFASVETVLRFLVIFSAVLVRLACLVIRRKKIWTVQVWLGLWLAQEAPEAEFQGVKIH